jgi:hypothetical protein
VEIATDPDFGGEEFCEEGIISGPSWVMHMLSQVALGVGDEAWEFHREFLKRTSSAEATRTNRGPWTALLCSAKTPSGIAEF